MKQSQGDFAIRGVLVAAAFVVAATMILGTAGLAQEEPRGEPAEEEAPRGRADGITVEEGAEAGAAGVGYLPRLEWRGVMALGPDVQFSLHEPSEGVSFWIGFEEIRHGIEVVEYDPEEMLLTLREGNEARTVPLSGSSMGDLPPAQVAQAGQTEPPPLVVTPGLRAEQAAMEPESIPEEIAAEARQVAGLWQDAITQEPRLREVDDHFRQVRMESQRIEEAMTQVPDEAPEFQALENRRDQLREEERMLTEIALGEVRASPELRDRVRQPLGDALRDQVFGSPVQPRTRSPEEFGEIDAPAATPVEPEPQVLPAPVEEVEGVEPTGDEPVADGMDPLDEDEELPPVP